MKSEKEEKEFFGEKKINMINFSYTMIKHLSYDNFTSLQNNKWDFVSIAEGKTFKNTLIHSPENYSVCVIGEKNIGKSLLISKLIV